MSPVEAAEAPESEELEAICYLYLSEQPATLWADWNISDPNRRTLAAKWLARQITQVYEFQNRNYGVPVSFRPDFQQARRDLPA